MTAQHAASRVTRIARWLSSEITHKGNIAYSPLGACAVLDALSEGAAGSTRHRLDQLLGVSGRGAAELNVPLLVDGICPLPQERKPPGGRGALRVASGVWVARGYKLRPEFASSIERRLAVRVVHASVRDAEDAALRLRASIARPGSVPASLLLGSSPPELRLLLANVVHMEDFWRKPFSHIWRGTFHLLNKSTVPVPMMTERWWGFGYAAREDFTAAELPYRTLDCSMIVVLPSKPGRASLDRSERWVLSNGDKLRTSLAERDTYLTIHMPPFDIDFDVDLLRLPSLRSVLGSGADLSAISSEPGLHVSSLKQSVSVHVDNWGTTATSFTSVAVVGASGTPHELTLDRPFLFQIVQRSTGLMLFAGRVVHPKSSRRFRYRKPPGPWVDPFGFSAG